MTIHAQEAFFVVENRTQIPLPVEYDRSTAELVDYSVWDVAQMAGSPNVLDHGYMLAWKTNSVVIRPQERLELRLGENEYVQNVRFELPPQRFVVKDLQQNRYTRDQLRGLRIGNKQGFLNNFVVIVEPVGADI